MSNGISCVLSTIVPFTSQNLNLAAALWNRLSSFKKFLLYIQEYRGLEVVEKKFTGNGNESEGQHVFINLGGFILMDNSIQCEECNKICRSEIKFEIN